MKISIILLIVLMFIINLITNFLSLSYQKKELPLNVKDVYDDNEYKKWSSYNTTKIKRYTLSSIINLVSTVILLVFNVHLYLFNIVKDITSNSILQLLLIFSILSLYELLINIGFQIYDTFVIEEKFGFNNTSKKLFIKDTIIQFIFGVILEVLLIGGLQVIYNAFDNIYMFLIISLVIITTIILVIPFIYPLFNRLFNKMTLLEDGSLKEKINVYLLSVNFPLTNIYIVDASKRSKELNAYFLGYGKKRRIVLYDTLLESTTDEQIVAIVAHEAGHSHYKDFLSSIPLSILTLSIMLVALFLFISLPSISTSFGFNDTNFVFGIIIFMEVFGLIGIFTNIFTNYISRVKEYRADKYAAETYNKEAIIESLIVIHAKSLADLNPHPINIILKYNHPSLTQRLDALEQL